jgi:hypothetical protein
MRVIRNIDSNVVAGPARYGAAWSSPARNGPPDVPRSTKGFCRHSMSCPQGASRRSTTTHSGGSDGRCCAWRRTQRDVCSSTRRDNVVTALEAALDAGEGFASTRPCSAQESQARKTLKASVAKLLEEMRHDIGVPHLEG